MSSTIGWGSNSYFQLGLVGSSYPEDDNTKDGVLTPTVINSLNELNFEVLGIACGWNHTIVWLSNGVVYSTGLNDHGQLGYSNAREKNGFEWIKALETQNIVHASCGEAHTVLVNSDGCLYSFGNNGNGQLGVPNSSMPQLIKGVPLNCTIVKVSCGKNHTIALGSTGDVFSWGANEYGQCGVGIKSNKAVAIPHRISFCFAFPIYKISAGGNHSLILSISGSLFSWGKNDYGQLGLGDNIDRTLPTKIKMLSLKSIYHIDCGEDHTMALTSAGGVFTFGCGSSGQLGHNSYNDEYNPRMVTELMGTAVIQISCGRKHSLAYVSRTGKLYSFGLGASGQLGKNSLEKKNSPCVVRGNWCVDQRVNDNEFMKYLNENNLSYYQDDYLTTLMYLLKGNQSQFRDKGTNYCIHEIFAGGLCSFATTLKCQARIEPIVHCMMKQENLLSLTQVIVRRMMDQPSADKSCKLLSTVFSSCSCLNASFLKRNNKQIPLTHGVHLMAVRNSFNLLNSNEKFSKLIMHCVKETLIPALQYLADEPESLRVFIIIPELPFFDDMNKMWEVIIPYANSFLLLSDIAQKIIVRWWNSFPATFFEKNIVPYKKCIEVLLEHKLPETQNTMIFTLHEALKACIIILEKLNKINDECDNIVSYTTFYIDGLMEKINVKADYVNWIQQPSAFSFCKYPFVFNVKVKASLLRIDAERQMNDAVKEAHMSNINGLVHGNLQFPSNPLLILDVRREHIVRDTLSEISLYPPHEMKKPLKVKFSQEDAEDAGGVRKEFFLLLMREILDPKYGMFEFYEDTNVIWFKCQSFEDSNMFMLIGVICGLAIYNSTIIDFPFPVCLYKKLLNKKLNLDDLRGLQPTVARGLQDLLDYTEDDLSEVFSLYFQLIEHSFGETRTVDLIHNGSTIEVTQENKEEYVNAYIDYKLNSSVEKEFQAFSLGFHRVCGGIVLNLFHPQELMEFVVGSQEYDFSELEIAATYHGEYFGNHPVIQRFWNVFHNYSTVMKKKFLAFLTGSDKVSVFGMKNMKFIIQPVKSSENHLPVAHTCFNLLDLPRYSSVDILRKKLTLAIENSQWFGLV